MKARPLAVLLLLALSAFLVVVPEAEALTTVTTSTAASTQVLELSNTNSVVQLGNYFVVFFQATSTALDYTSCKFTTSACSSSSGAWAAPVRLFGTNSIIDFAVFADNKNSKIYVLGATSAGATNKTMRWERYSLSSLGVLSEDIARQKFALSLGYTFRSSSVLFNQIDLYFAVSTCTTAACSTGATAHIEIWQCAGAGAGCTMTKVNDLSFLTNSNRPLIGVLSKFPDRKVAFVYGYQATTAVLNYTACPTTCTGSGSWTSTVSSSANYVSQKTDCIALASVLNCVSARSTSLWRLALTEGGGSFTESQIDASNGPAGQVATDNASRLIFEGCGTTTCRNYNSFDSGSSFVNPSTTLSNDTNVINPSLHTQTFYNATADILLGCYTQGAASPFNIKCFEVSKSGEVSVTLTLNAGGGSASISGSNYFTVTFTQSGLAGSIHAQGITTTFFADPSTTATIGATSSASTATHQWAITFSGGAATTTTFNTGTGTTLSQTYTYYEQYKPSCQVTPLTPNLWNDAYTFTVTGTQLGIAGTTICTLNAVNGGGAVSSSGWEDVGTVEAYPASVTDSVYVWVGNAPTSFTVNDATAQNVNYVISNNINPEVDIWLLLIPLVLVVALVLSRKL